MHTRFKLAALAGLESLSTDTLVEDQKVTVVNDVLTPDDATKERQLNEALAEATSDVKESTKLVETFVEQQEKQEQAITDLEEAVAGFEGLFEGEFSQEAYNRLMRHTERCAQRAGVELPIKLEGMESMTTASIYLETRNGLEGFMDSVKKAGNNVKEVIMTIYKYLREMIKGWLAQFGGLAGKIEHALKVLKDVKDLKPEIKVGKWNELLNIEKDRLFKTSELQPLMVMASEVAKASLTDITVSGIQHSERLKSMDSLCDAVTSRSMKFNSSNTGKFLETHIAEFANLKITFIIPGKEEVGANAFRDFRISHALKNPVNTEQHKSLFNDKRAVEQELKELLTFVKSMEKTFDKIDTLLFNERDALISVVNTGMMGANRSDVVAALNAKRRLITGLDTTVFNLLDAKFSVLRAHF